MPASESMVVWPVGTGLLYERYKSRSRTFEGSSTYKFPHDDALWMIDEVFSHPRDVPDKGYTKVLKLLLWTQS